jgi:UDP-glucose 4-epimerase
MSLLITGGTGYIGSHTIVELQALASEQDIVIVDDLSNSSTKALDRIEKITGKTVTFIKADICDYDAMNEVFTHIVLMR